MVKYCNNICYIMPFRFGDLLQPVGWRGNILRRKIWILPVSEFLPVLRMRRCNLEALASSNAHTKILSIPAQ